MNADISTRIPATNIDDAYNACHPEIPLEHGDPRYVDLTSVRGEFNLARIVARRIRRTPYPLFHKQLITGHRGCGKSTELKKLYDELRDRDGKFFLVYLDIEDVLDLGDIEYLDVLLAIVRGVYEGLQEAQIDLPGEFLKTIEAWFADTVLTQAQRVEIERSIKAGTEAERGITSLGRIFAAAAGTIRAGGSRRTEIRQKLEREQSVFINRLNELMDEARSRLTDGGWKGLVVIVDGLEKMQYRELSHGETSHSVLFVQHAELLKALRCHMIYTVPVSLVFNANLGDVFPDTDFIPMVKINERDGVTPYDKGRHIMFDIVASRVDVPAVFESKDIIDVLVERSGGVVRDLLRLIRFAFDEADDKVIDAHANSAIRRLEREYDFLIRDEHKESILQIARDLRVSGDEESAWLLHQRLVLEYRNDERWHDLHPVVKSNPRVQEWLKNSHVT